MVLVLAGGVWEEQSESQEHGGRSQCAVGGTGGRGEQQSEESDEHGQGAMQSLATVCHPRCCTSGSCSRFSSSPKTKLFLTNPPVRI